MLLHWTERLGGSLADSDQDDNVQGLRCMTTWCVVNRTDHRDVGCGAEGMPGPSGLVAKDRDGQPKGFRYHPVGLLALDGRALCRACRTGQRIVHHARGRAVHLQQRDGVLDVARPGLSGDRTPIKSSTTESPK
jgi:hypothetical protein